MNNHLRTGAGTGREGERERAGERQRERERSKGEIPVTVGNGSALRAGRMGPLPRCLSPSQTPHLAKVLKVPGAFRKAFVKTMGQAFPV